MALDVHIVVIGSREPEKGSYTSFGFGDEHEAVFRLADSEVAASSQIARMKDYYDDVIYEGDDLICLIAELDWIIPTLHGMDNLRVVLEKYRGFCVRAAQENKAILLFAD